MHVSERDFFDEYSCFCLPPTMNSYRIKYRQFVEIQVLFMERQEDSVLPGR